MPTFSFPTIDPERFAVLIALGFFLGLAFEEYFAKSHIKPPGGVRTFPLLALSGALLYALEPQYGLLFFGGLAILGTWLSIYYRERLTHQLTETENEIETPPRLDAGIMAPTGNILAFLLGPVTLAAPLWIAVSVAVAAVLFTGARERLHALAAKLGPEELSTLGKFLIITGIILPLVPHEPMTTLTDITPYEVWLAVVAVSTLSYASYLMQRFFAPRHGVLISAALGGLYSSTATTVVLSRRARTSLKQPARTQGAIVLATAIMFLRIITVVGIFSMPLAQQLLPSIATLCVAGLLISGGIAWFTSESGNDTPETTTPTNPLELSTAIIFAMLFIALSIAVTWAKTQYGESGIFALGFLAGFADVDPFVLSLAQGTARAIDLNVAASAILVAASSNNLLKATYTLAFAGRTNGLRPALALFVLAAAGFAAALHSLGWL